MFEVKVVDLCGKEITMSKQFITKDSGKREEFSSGMKRDIQNGKPRYDLLDRPMLRRWAELMARGAEKYGENNWQRAETRKELERFKASAFRHFMAWMEEMEDEDHASACFFNIAGVEMVKAKLRKDNEPTGYEQFPCEDTGQG